MTNVLKLNSKWSSFDLELILRYEKALISQRGLEISQRLLSFYEKRDFKLIRLIWYVKLHGKHFQIRNNTKFSLHYICIDQQCFWGKILIKRVTAAAAAKSLQLCPTLCDPIDGSPPGSPVPGILQARTLEWVAISFSNAWKWKVKVKLLSCVWLLATPWTAGHQAPPPMGFSRQEYWSRVPRPAVFRGLFLSGGASLKTNIKWKPKKYNGPEWNCLWTNPSLCLFL